MKETDIVEIFVPFRLYHMDVIRMSLVGCETLLSYRYYVFWAIDITHAGAIELSKHPNNTRRVIKPPKFFAVQFNVVIRPQRVTRPIS